MSPVPINSSLGMFIALAVAFVVTPLLTGVKLVVLKLASKHFLYITAFVGAKLFQIGCSCFCQAESIMGKLGMKRPG